MDITIIVLNLLKKILMYLQKVEISHIHGQKILDINQIFMYLPEISFGIQIVIQ